ncbi:MAG: WD40 repeat domain-containing protein, partial [Pirellulaceae bacterium]
APQPRGSTQHAPDAAQARRLSELAEKGKRLAEVRQGQLQVRVGRTALDSKNLEKAAAELGRIPERVQSWDTARMQLETRLRPHPAMTFPQGRWAILGLAVAPDGKTLVTADASGLLQVWDLAQKREGKRLAEGRWSKDKHRWLNYYEDRKNELDLAARGPCFVSVCWLGDSGRVAAASMDGQLVWFETTGEECGEIFRSESPLYAIAATVDGKQILCGDATGRVILRSLDNSLNSESALSESPVTAIVWAAEQDAWIVGHEDGTLRVLTGTDLQVWSTKRVPGPVWSLDVSRYDGTDWLAIGCGAPRIHLNKFAVDGDEIRLLTDATLEYPGNAQAIHSVHFVEGGKRLFAIDDERQLSLWDTVSREVVWTVRASVRDDRPQAPTALLEQQIPPKRPASPFQRVGSVTSIGRQGERIITAGQDAAWKLWDVEPTFQQGILELTQRVGPNPRLAFDRQRTEVLWVLDEKGDLWALDSREDRLLGHRRAHAGGAADLAVAAGSGTLITVGNDADVRFWDFSQNKISPAHLKRLRHERPLISVAASGDGRWVAAVDEQAYLVVWQYQTGKRVFLTRLSGSEDERRPLTGRVAFNNDGSRLAAFGPGQSAHVFSTRPFDRMDEQIWVAGSGGTALAWSPVSPDMVVAADDYPRYVPRHFGGETRDRGEGPLRPEQTCAAMTTTPDQRRIVLLEKHGRIIFLESEFLAVISECINPRRLSSHLAFDKDGRRLALAGKDGSIEIWESDDLETQKPVTFDDETSRWAEISLSGPMANVLWVDARSVRLDPLDRLCMLAVESAKSIPNYRDEGELHFIRQERGAVLRERIQVDGGVADRRMNANSTALAFQANGEPVAIFRRRTAEQSPYDGSVHLASRLGLDDWEIETVHAHGNHGFYPAVNASAGLAIDEILHFSFDGFLLLKSTPPADGQTEWQADVVGWQGDGSELLARHDGKGRWHLLFKPNRFNQDPGPRIYARLDGDKLLRDVPDPAASLSGTPRLLPDGTPVLIRYRQQQGSDRPQAELVKRVGDRWTMHARLPEISGVFRQQFALRSSGEALLISWLPENRQLILWRVASNGWSAAIIAEDFDDGDPNSWTIELDRKQSPVVVVGRIGVEHGLSWIRVLRPTN